MEAAVPSGDQGSHEKLLIAGLFLVPFILVMATQSSYGWTWDEGYYMPTFVDAWKWIKLFFTSPGAALSTQGYIDGWGLIHELPPVSKWIGAMTYGLAPKGYEYSAIRCVTAMLFSGTIVILYQIAKDWSPRPVAALAAMTYALHPRVFGHGHIAATETIFAFVSMVTLWVAFRDMSKRRWQVALILCVGLALATKVNGLILTVAIVGWLFLRSLCDHPLMDFAKGKITSDPADSRRDIRLGLLILLLSPIFAVAIWPWMWFETRHHILNYWNFITVRVPQGVWYLGEKWNYPTWEVELAPWHYAYVMTLVTAPVSFLVAALGGIVFAIRRFIKSSYSLDPRDFLLLLLIAGPYASMTLPNTPRYDGIRLFFPVLAPFVLLASRMFADRQGDSDWNPGKKVKVELVTFAVFTLGAFALNFRSGLASFNVPTHLITRIKGKTSPAEFPFETAYWMDGLTPAAVEELNLFLPPNANVKPLASFGQTLELQQEIGLLRDDIQFGGEPPYDYHLVQWRKGFWGRVEWWLLANEEPLWTWNYPGPLGAPAFSLYGPLPSESAPYPGVRTSPVPPASP